MQGISKYKRESFWDTDPGQGLGTSIVAIDGNFNQAVEQMLSVALQFLRREYMY